MKDQKENEKESGKEKERENRLRLLRRFRYAKDSVLANGMKAGDVYDAAKGIDGMTEDEACDWIDYMKAVDWLFPNGDAVDKKNFRRSLRMWHEMDGYVKALRERQAAVAKAAAAAVRRLHKSQRFCGVGQDAEEMERIKAKAAAERLAKAMAEDGAWTLCEERCAEFRAEGCVRCRHWSVPPQLRERPVPPEECIHFKAKGE